MFCTGILNCCMTNCKPFRWLVKTLSSDVYHYRTTNVSAVNHATLQCRERHFNLGFIIFEYHTHYHARKASVYSITERRVPELIPVLGSQPAGDVNHKPDGRLPLLSTRPAVTLKRAATNFAAWWTEAQWVWAVCLKLLPDSVATAIWTQALLHLSPAR